MQPWVKQLLAWYAENKRTMPWRGHPDPYAVWVSEIMLQQTQVNTVRPYFERFLKAFPSVQALAEAEDTPLFKAWEGLGYYTRVRNLRKAAQIICGGPGGRLPATAGELEKLPGIGPYTAAAIASIAFGEATPVVDGNVARVFARRNALKDDFTKLPPRRKLADWLTPHIRASGSPADFNQAMMELGALVCTPRNPQCGNCPLKTACRAYKTGSQARYPVPPASKTIPKHSAAVVLLRDTADRVLLVRYKGTRLLGNLWALPHPDDLPFAPPGLKSVGTHKQTFSHFQLTLDILSAPPVNPDALPPRPSDRKRTPRAPTQPETVTDLRWVADPAELPLTTGTRKILAAHSP